VPWKTVNQSIALCTLSSIIRHRLHILIRSWL